MSSTPSPARSGLHAPVAASAVAERGSVSWIALGLVAAVLVVASPFLPWVILAMWTAGLARHLHRPLSRWLGGRVRLAAALTIVFGALLLVPIVVWMTLLAIDAVELVRRLASSGAVHDTLQSLVSSRGSSAQTPTDLLGLVMDQGGRAWSVLQQVAGTAARVVIGIVVFVAGIYAILVEGDAWYRWIEARAPISKHALRRFADAFVETGRGLVIGIAGAGLAQAIVATVIFVVLGVPQPFALGFLTLVGSIVPAVGTAIVWLPVAVGLFIVDRTGSAVVMVIAGVVVIGSIDNLVRPFLARRGHLQLPTFVVLVAMFGGVVVLGPWGVLLAPLVVRLAKEAVELRRPRGEAELSAAP